MTFGPYIISAPAMKNCETMVSRRGNQLYSPQLLQIQYSRRDDEGYQTYRCRSSILAYFTVWNRHTIPVSMIIGRITKLTRFKYRCYSGGLILVAIQMMHKQNRHRLQTTGPLHPSMTRPSISVVFHRRTSKGSHTPVSLWRQR